MTLSTQDKKERDELLKRVRIIDKDLWEMVDYYAKDYPDLELIHTGSLEFSNFTLGLSPNIAKKIMSPKKFKEWYDKHSLDTIIETKSLDNNSKPTSKTEN